MSWWDGFPEPTQAPASSSDVDANTAAITALQLQLSSSDQKESVRVVSLTNLTLSGTQTIDGIACVAGDRVGALGQTLSQNSGIYVVAAGAWSRAPDADTSAEVTSGMFFWVTEGTANGDKAFELTTDDPIVLGTTPLTFQQFAGALKTSQVVNDSAVTGATDKDALNTLNALIATLTTAQALDNLFSPATNQIVLSHPLAGSGSGNTFGPYPAIGTLGTPTGRTPDNTSYGSRKLRVGCVTAAGAGQDGGVYFYTIYASNSGYFSRETGFALKMGALIAAVSANSTLMLGCGHLNALGFATPSGKVNSMFLGYDGADANAQIMHNDGSGACTKIDLGSNFPARTVGDFYDLLLWCAPGSATINYTVNRHTSAGALFTSSGTISGANVPAAGAQWYPVVGGNNGAAGGVCAVDSTGFYLAIPH